MEFRCACHKKSLDFFVGWLDMLLAETPVQCSRVSTESCSINTQSCELCNIQLAAVNDNDRSASLTLAGFSFFCSDHFI